MANPASNTTFPAEYDPLPAIEANDKQNDPGIEHDVVHDRAHAVLNALQVLIGYGDSPDPASVLGMLGEIFALGDPRFRPVVTDGATAYTCQAEHVGQYRVLTAATAKTITVQEPLPDNFEIHFDNRGAAAVTVAGAQGASVVPSAGSTAVFSLNGVVTLKRLSANLYRLVGTLEPAA